MWRSGLRAIALLVAAWGTGLTAAGVLHDLVFSLPGVAALTLVVLVGVGQWCSWLDRAGCAWSW